MDRHHLEKGSAYRIAVLLCGLVAGFQISAAAQVVRGRILDNQTGTPVVNGTAVLFLDSLGTAVARTLSDSTGHYELIFPRPGRYTLRAGGLGYRGGFQVPLDLATGEETTYDIYLEPEPLELDPLLVTAERIRSELERQGFFERLERGRGFFMTPAYLKRRPPITEAELIGRAPFVEIQRSWTGSRILMREAGRQCAPMMFIDDMEVRGGNLEDHVNFADIIAVEVYRGYAEIPQELAVGWNSCGVVMVWTVWSELRSKKAKGGGR